LNPSFQFRISEYDQFVNRLVIRLSRFFIRRTFKFLPRSIKDILDNQKNAQIEILRNELREVIEKLSFDNSVLRDSLSVQNNLLAEYMLKETYFLENRIVIHRHSSFDSELHLLAEVYGSDKGGDPSKSHPYPHKTHNYVDAYELVFSNLKIEVLDVLECGIGTNNPLIESNMGINGKPGASLRMWSSYFPAANIFGVDIDQSILFEESRIKTFQMDQTSKSSIKNFLEKVDFQEFDIIIDDGLHNFVSNKSLFDNLIPYLRSGGIYIIEDVVFQDLHKYKSLYSQDDLEMEIICLERVNTDLGDNNLVIYKKKL